MLVEQDPELFMEPHFCRVVRTFSYVLPFLHLAVLHFVAPAIFVVALFYFLTYPYTEAWINPAFRRALHWCDNPKFERIGKSVELRHSDKFSDDITLKCVEEYRSDVRANIRELATVRNYFWIADTAGLALNLLFVYPRSIALVCRHRPYIILGFLLVALLMAALNNTLAYLGLYTTVLYRLYLVSQEARKLTTFTVDYRWETFSLRHAIWLLGTTSKTNQEQAVSPLLGCRTTLTYAPDNYMLIMLQDPHRRTTVSSFDTGGTRVPYEQGLLKLRTVLLLYTKFVNVQIRQLIRSRPSGNKSLIPNLEFTVQAPDRVTVLFRRGLIFLLINFAILLSLLVSIL